MTIWDRTWLKTHDCTSLGTKKEPAFKYPWLLQPTLPERPNRDKSWSVYLVQPSLPRQVAFHNCPKLNMLFISIRTQPWLKQCSKLEISDWWSWRRTDWCISIGVRNLSHRQSAYHTSPLYWLQFLWLVKFKMHWLVYFDPRPKTCPLGSPPGETLSLYWLQFLWLVRFNPTATKTTRTNRPATAIS